MTQFEWRPSLGRIDIKKKTEEKSKTPIVIVPTTYVNFSEQEIRKLGINHVIYANQLIRSRVDSQKNVLNILNNKKKLSSIENKIAPLKDILKICGLFELNNNESESETIERTTIFERFTQSLKTFLDNAE